MTSLPRMSLHIGDYRKDTGHLRAAGHGAYLLLIMHYWATGSLPDDDRQLATIACLSGREWKIQRPILKAFFHDGWKHKRIDAELEQAQGRYEKRAAAGREGGKAPRTPTKKGSNAEAMLEQKPPNAEATLTLLKKEKKEKNTEAVASVSIERARASRLPADWQPSEADLTFAQQAGFALLDSKRLADDFRDYWHARAGPQGLKLNWPATWRRWVRTAAERRGNGTGQRLESTRKNIPRTNPFGAALDRLEQHFERQAGGGDEASEVASRLLPNRGGQ